MKIVVLDYETLGSDIDLSPLDSVGEVVVYKNTTEAELDARIKDAQILVSNKIKYTHEHLSCAKNLELICVTATGYDNVCVDYCSKHNIAVCNIKDYCTESVAQLTVSMVLALVTNLKAYNEYVSSGDYVRSGVANKLTPVFHELSSLTWGIIGCGNIGRRVREIAVSLGCRTVVSTHSDTYGGISVDELSGISDIITVHVPLNDETKNLIDEKQIGLMKDNVVLVNTSRGGVCNEKALADAIIDGKIGALGIDVYSKEPFDETHPYNKIKDLNNVILTPHMAWGAYEARTRCIDEVVKNITAFRCGDKRNRVV